MPTLLLLNNAYWPSLGGVENSIRHLTVVATERGFSVKIVVSDLALPNDATNRWRARVDGADVYRYPLKPVGWLGPLNFILGYLAQKRVLRSLRANYPDARVVSRFHLSTLAARAVGFSQVVYLVPGLAQTQYTAGMGLLDRLRQPGFLLKRVVHSFLQKRALGASEVHVFSELMRQQCESVVPTIAGSIKVVKPGVDTERFSYPSAERSTELRVKLGLPLDKRLVLFAGRFVPAKGVDILIRALTALPGDVCLVIVGEGSEESAYRGLIADGGLAERVTMRSTVRDVEDYFQCCDVFAMSSNYEPLGQTVLEALACGTPIAAFSRDAGVLTATEELGFDDYIAYADEYTPEAFAEAISSSLEMSASQRMAQAREAAKAFSWSKLFDDMLTG
jgi:1,2-diacylglycerol 3-alpha-glucosyltransferase